MGLLVSAVIVFIGGLLAGFAARLFLPITLTNVFIHARLWPEELFVLAIGAITLVASFVRSESKPFLPSVIIAYAFYLPINAGGFGLGSGVDGIWPQGILVFATHFMLASILGLLTLLALKLRPSTRGLILSGIMLLVFWNPFQFDGKRLPAHHTANSNTATPTSTTQPTALPSLTLSLPATTTNTSRPSSTTKPSSTPTVDETTSATSTEEDAANTSTATTAATATKPAATPTKTSSTPAATSTAVSIPTITATVELQTIAGTISADEGGGANLRQTPNGKYLMTSITARSSRSTPTSVW
ncbi:hypothetical protein [Candidatus Villigracilis affinis]|uniref:hypothetical protein n=1 Tax=Candidatus Villigracilis affinis TaxID=3140682 RepID=UPI001D9B1D6E|nr:hypothetical protein [Anaerolineales bacterium]